MKALGYWMLAGCLALAGCAEAAPANGMAAYDTVASPAETGAVTEEGSKIAVSGSLSLQVKDVKAAAEQIDTLLGEQEGKCLSRNYSDYDNNPAVWMDVQVPADRFDAFCESVQTLGKTLNFNTYSEDVTKSWTDANGRIESLEIQETRLKELLKQAETVTDLMDIETRLADVQSQLEMAHQALDSIDTQVEYSDLTISLESMPTLENGSTGAWATISSALRNTGTAFVEGMGWVLAILIYILPWAAAIGLVVWILLKLTKKKLPKVPGSKKKK